MSEKKKIFTDNYSQLLDFAEKILVVCPKCKNPAWVKINKLKPRLICNNCGYLKEWIEKAITTSVGGPYDPYFQEELYLKTDCCGGVFFAFNQKHLNYLKNYVESEIRQRNKNQDGYKNRSLISRLPKWVKLKKNRVEILKKIHDLQEKYDDIKNKK